MLGMLCHLWVTEHLSEAVSILFDHTICLKASGGQFQSNLRRMFLHGIALIKSCLPVLGNLWQHIVWTRLAFTYGSGGVSTESHVL